MVNQPKDKPQRTEAEDLGYRFNGSSWQPIPEEEDEYSKKKDNKISGGPGKKSFRDDNRETHA